MEPSLFRLASPQSAAGTRPGFSTPAGLLRLTLAVNGEPLPESDAATYAAGGRRVLVWVTPAGRAELLMTRPELALPPGMRVDGAAGAVWRVSSDVESRLELTAAWAEGAPISSVGPESGENLDAQSWTDGRTRVMVGLPDYGPTTSYRPDGFRLVHELAPGNRWEAHLVCAWATEPVRDESLWFAVDCTPRQLLGDLAPAG